MRRNHENVQNPAPYEQMREVVAMVVKAVPQLSISQAAYFIGRQRQVAAQIRAVFSGAGTRSAWNIITERPGVKTSQLIAECRALFPVWCWQADDGFDKDFPAPAEATTRGFGPNIEADPEHANKSYNDLRTAGINGITLRERLIMELQYFRAIGKHLDEKNVTLCSGSLYRHGNPPSVNWDFGSARVLVDWRRGDSRRENMCSRQVVV